MLKKSIFGLVAGLFLFSAIPASANMSTDPEYPRQAAVYKQISLPDAWNYTTGSPAVTVAILDTGVDINHPDLKDNIWTNTLEIPDNGIDDDYNGYIDDVHGWNFVEQNNNVIGEVKSTFFGDEAVSHGTVIAGLIGADGDNNIFGSGLNWRVKIMPVRAIDNYGSGLYEDIAKAIDYAASNGADIISLSFVGYSDEDVLYEALRRAYARNVLIVVAAGNNRATYTGDLDKNILYPVCYQEYAGENWLLGVTAVNKNDQLSEFANYGSCIDIAAPGENIYSTTRLAGEKSNLQFAGPWYGTSFATPLVAGTAALIKSIQPEWSVQKLISTILSTSDDIEAFNPNFIGQLGYGRLNAGAAVQLAMKEKMLTGPFSNICYPAGSAVYCHSLITNKSQLIGRLKGSPIVFDGTDQELSAALLKSNAKYSLTSISKSGNFETNIALEPGLDFNIVRVAAVDKKRMIFLAGYDKKTLRTRIASYSRDGKRGLSWWVSGRIDALDADEQGNIYLAGIKNNRLIIEGYSNQGKFFKKMDLGPATRADDIAVGDFDGTGSVQIAAIVRRGKQAYRYISLRDSASFLTDRLTDTNERWHLMAQDYDFDKTLDLLVYNHGGGQFNIVSGKGKTLKNTVIPSLK